LREDRKIEVNGNKITIYLNQHGEPGYDKVSGAFGHRSSKPNILTNVMQILQGRITTKATKCLHLSGANPIWLALFNDYWLTEADTYRYALTQMSIEHRFQKILLVGGDRSVETLCEK
jgi:hypothetical protein